MTALPEWLRRRLPPSRRIEWFPPFRDMRVRVLDLDPQWQRVRLHLPLNRRNRNPAGAMFGGCVAALADPVAALACASRHPAYSVWTRELRVEFVREGRSDLELRFEFDPRLAGRIGQELERRGRSTPRFEYGVYRADGRLAAWIISRVAIRPAGYRGSEPRRAPVARQQPHTERRTRMSEHTEDTAMDLSSGIAAFEAKHFSRAIQLLSPLADAGDPDAQYRMAIMAQNGLGMTVNELMAYKYMKGAAEQGHALAQHGLGFMYMEGECVEQNAEKAVAWLKRAAEQGLAGSQTTLAMMYEEGRGVEKDPEEARKWYKKAGFDT